MEPYTVVILLVVVGGICIGLGFLLNLLAARMKKQNATLAAREIIQEAETEANRIRKDAELSSKDEIYQKREELEREIQEAKHEIRDSERRLAKREDSLDRKVDLLNKKERYIENVERSLTDKRKTLDAREKELADTLDEQKATLHRIAGLSEEEARQQLLTRLQAEMEQECMQLQTKIIERTKEGAEQKAREIIAMAIQRCAADHTAECVVSSVELPNDDMKGRIIGREGRNIRAFERATGVDVIVDDTPGVVVVSGFDGVRREVARRSLEKLIVDGRIHPARIEEVVQSTAKEVEQIIREAGKQTTFDVGVHGLNNKEIELLGRLKYRTSYGQNVLQHSIEVATLSGLIAGELGLDVQLAKRCGLLHDIGKAIDQEMEGTHPQIGADLAKRFGEKPEVINAISGHHDNIEPTSLYTVIVAAADAISASRPGARRESLEKYIKRLERLEGIATSHSGVDSAYAIQAGREIRVIVNAEKVNDKAAAKMCRDIANEIQEELNYPGEVRVTLIRETRCVEYAR
ncbi:MAG: ribonuclease Y [Planctomycetota bacterium]